MNLGDLTKQLTQIDASLDIAEVDVKKQYSVAHTNKVEVTHMIRDTSDPKNQRVVGYINFNEHAYFDGESIKGGPYAISGRPLQIKSSVLTFFEEQDWKCFSR